jgi:hypothetical protein
MAFSKRNGWADFREISHVDWPYKGRKFCRRDFLNKVLLPIYGAL